MREEHISRYCWPRVTRIRAKIKGEVHHFAVGVGSARIGDRQGKAVLVFQDAGTGQWRKVGIGRITGVKYRGLASKREVYESAMKGYQLWLRGIYARK